MDKFKIETHRHKYANDKVAFYCWCDCGYKTTKLAILTNTYFQLYFETVPNTFLSSGNVNEVFKEARLIKTQEEKIDFVLNPTIDSFQFVDAYRLHTTESFVYFLNSTELINTFKHYYHLLEMNQIIKEANDLHTVSKIKEAPYDLLYVANILIGVYDYKVIAHTEKNNKDQFIGDLNAHAASHSLEVDTDTLHQQVNKLLSHIQE